MVDLLQHAHVQGGAYMRRSRNGPCTTQAQVVEDLRVLTGQHLGVAVLDQGHGGLAVAAAVLHRRDARVAHDAAQGFTLDAYPGAVGDVVDDHRHAGGIRHGAEERLDAGLRRPDVARCRDQQPANVAPLDFSLEGQQLAQVVARQAHHHPARLHPGQHGIQHGQLLGLGQRRSLARGTAYHKTGHTLFEQLLHQLFQGGEVDFIGAHWRDEGDPDTTEIRHAKTPDVDRKSASAGRRVEVVWQGYLAPSVSSAHLTRQRASVR